MPGTFAPSDAASVLGAGPGGPDQTRAASAASTTAEAQSSANDVTRILAQALGLEDSPVTVYGWIENSYAATPGFSPRNGSTVTLAPDRLANQWQGNQYYLILENPLEREDRVNFGFRLDTLFGNDWYFTHSFGMFNAAFTPLSFAGLDLPQIFGEVHLPLGKQVALDIKGGRFYSPTGFEAVQAVKRTLFSFPYAVTYTPFTFLGAMTSLHLGDRFTLFNGAVNGADRWFDENFHFSYLGGLNWNSKSRRSSLTSFLLVGPNQLPFFPSLRSIRTAILPVGGYTVPGLAGQRNPYYNRSTLVYHSTVLSHKWGEEQRLTEAMEVYFVTQGNVLGFGPGGAPGRISYYGGAHWLLYELTPRTTAVARHEVFRDNNGFVLPTADNYYEMTYGLIIKPRPCLWIRPEIRYDWAQFTKPFDDDTQSGQLTLAFDVIVQF